MADVLRGIDFRNINGNSVLEPSKGNALAKRDVKARVQTFLKNRSLRIKQCHRKRHGGATEAQD